MKHLLFLLLVAVSSLSFASDTKVQDAIKMNVQPLIANEQIKTIKEVDKSGVYEVVTDRNLYYTTRTGSHLFIESNLIDVKSRSNLTEKTLQKMSEFKFKDLPLDKAITVIRGDGTRKIVTFEDPNCGYCKKLMGEFAKLDNVTIYTFIVPILGGDTAAKTDSLSRAKSIMCSENPSKTWVDFMSKPNYVLAAKECDTSFDVNRELFDKLRLKGTPVILFESNTKIPSMATAAQIESKLNESKQKGGAQ